MKKLIENPKSENKITGLLPYLSLKLPKTGAKRNCMKAYKKLSQPPYLEASLTSPLINSSINLGTTGITIPHPVISMIKVININQIAAVLFEFFIQKAKIHLFRFSKNFLTFIYRLIS